MKNNSQYKHSNGTTLSEKHYRDILKKNIFRLFFTYIAPLIILLVFFELSYSSLVSESESLHIKSIAENKSRILDLFLRERVVNLRNIIDDPKFHFLPSSKMLDSTLRRLQRSSDAFIDIGFFDTTGIQSSYAGPLPILEKKNYSNESWYKNLKVSSAGFIITDIYLGFRKKPHFTIAVSKIIGNNNYVLRATLDPAKIYEYISSLEVSRDVNISIINKDGFFQLAPHELGSVLQKSQFRPSIGNAIGISEYEAGGKTIKYAYCKLQVATWFVIVQKKEGIKTPFWTTQKIVFMTATLIIIILLMIIIGRARKYVDMEKEKDISRLQLEQATKLASVGELAAGIAHEINNPLAIIANEAGLMKDLMDPQFSKSITFEDLDPHLDIITDAVFRCRDITRKLLSFVRQTDIKLERHNINEILEDLIDGFFERELAVSNIKIIKQFSLELPEIETDANQIRQVILNIINNAIDAIKPPGKITVSTSMANEQILIAITDTGKGISRVDMEKIFLPFYTTKEVGKGTGLGLSVSYGIIKNLGGRIEVESVVGKGSTFTIILPIK